jgi:hypothetical protein
MCNCTYAVVNISNKPVGDDDFRHVQLGVDALLRWGCCCGVSSSSSSSSRTYLGLVNKIIFLADLAYKSYCEPVLEKNFLFHTHEKTDEAEKQTKQKLAQWPNGAFEVLP